MTVVSMALLEFENFDFLPPARLKLLTKLKCAPIFMKIDTHNNLMILFQIIQIKFRSFNFLFLSYLVINSLHFV